MTTRGSAFDAKDGATISGMTPDEVKAALTANKDRRVRLAFSDGVVQSVDIHSVDDEGFLHSGPDGIEPAYYWTRFDAVDAVEAAIRD